MKEISHLEIITNQGRLRKIDIVIDILIMQFLIKAQASVLEGGLEQGLIHGVLAINAGFISVKCPPPPVEKRVYGDVFVTAATATEPRNFS